MGLPHTRPTLAPHTKKEQKRMEFDEEFVILLRREQRGASVSGLVPMFLSVAGSRRLVGLIRLKYVPYWLRVHLVHIP